MRTLPLVMVGVLLLGSCGSAGETGPSVVETASPTEPTRPLSDSEIGTAVTDDLLERAELVAEVVITSFVDESAAITAVLLALDRGYSIEQTFVAAIEGRLLDDGVALTADGQVTAPELEPLGLFVEAATVGMQPASFRRGAPDPEPVPVVTTVDAIRTHMSRSGLSGLTMLLLLLEIGYSLEQIVLATLGNSELVFEPPAGLDPRVSGYLTLRDEDGRHINPERTGGPGWLSAMEDWSPTVWQDLEDRRATSPSSSSTTDTSDSGLHELVKAAEGVYRVSGDIQRELLAYPDAIRVNYAVGEMTVARDGTVAGTLEYSYTDFIEMETEPSFEVTWTTEVIVPPTGLSVRDDGLTFATDVTWNFCQDDDCTAFPWPVTGHIDPDLGVLVMGPLLTRGTGDVYFQR